MPIAFPNGSWRRTRGTGSDDDPTPEKPRSRRLVHRKALDEKQKYNGKPVVATRFVRACPMGHVDDLDWYGFVHRGPHECVPRLWLDESGATGELSNLRVRCSCKASRSMTEANEISRDSTSSGTLQRGRDRGSDRTRTRTATTPAVCSSGRPRTPISAPRPRPVDSRQGG